MQKNTEQTTKKENLNSNFGNSEKKIGTVPFAIGNTKNSNVYNLQPTGNTRQEIENTKMKIRKFNWENTEQKICSPPPPTICPVGKNKETKKGKRCKN